MGVLVTTDAIPATIVNPQTSATTAIASSISAVTLLAANTARKGASIYNDSTQALYVLRGTGTASVTNYSLQVAPGGYYELPAVAPCDVLKGVWPVANGYARVTEDV